MGNGDFYCKNTYLYSLFPSHNNIEVIWIVYRNSLQDDSEIKKSKNVKNGRFVDCWPSVDGWSSPGYVFTFILPQRLATSSGSKSLNSSPRPVHVMKFEFPGSSNSATKNCHNCNVPFLPDLLKFLEFKINIWTNIFINISMNNWYWNNLHWLLLFFFQCKSLWSLCCLLSMLCCCGCW